MTTQKIAGATGTISLAEIVGLLALAISQHDNYCDTITAAQAAGELETAIDLEDGRIDYLDDIAVMAAALLNELAQPSSDEEPQEYITEADVAWMEQQTIADADEQAIADADAEYDAESGRWL